MMHARTLLFSIFAAAFVAPAIAMSQTGPPVVFQGTVVTALGAATLSTGPSLRARATTAALPNKLFVGNLDFSGNDGVRMHTGGTSGALVEVQDLATTLPVGSEIAFGTNNASGINPCVRVARTATNATISPIFTPLGASTYRVEVWNDGAPVSEYDGLSGMLSTTTLPSAFRADLESVKSPLPDPFVLPAAQAFGLSEGFFLYWASDVTLMNAAGGSLGTGDELRLYPEGSSLLGSVDHVDVTVAAAGASPYTLGVDDLAQQMSGRMRRGSLGAIIAADSGKAEMSVPAGVLGATQVDVHESQSGECLIWDIKDGCASSGDTDDVSVVAELLTGGQGEVARASLSCDGTQWTVTPDFSGSGSSTVDVELLDDSGNLLGIAPGVTSFTVLGIEWATETGVEDADDLALVLGFPTPVSVNLPGAGVVTDVSRLKIHSNATRKHSFFAIVDRTVLSALANDFTVVREPNAFALAQGSTPVEFLSQGAAYGRKCHDCLVISNIGSSGDDGVDMGAPPDDSFGGIEWAPLGPAGAAGRETDWTFVTRHSSPDFTEQMSLCMVSNGSTVDVLVDPAASSTTEYTVVLKKAGVVVAQYSHSNLAAAFAGLADWPIAVGYQLHQAPDTPWSMWLDLGYDMDVTIPGAPVARTGTAATPLTKADLIEVLATKTTNPGPPTKTRLSGRFADLGHIVLLDRKPTPSNVGPLPRSAQSVLHPVYPNPFNPQTTLSFDLATSGVVSLRIYSVDGRHVATVHEGSLRAGAHAYPWNGIDQRGQPVASGVYLAELRTPDGVTRTKLNLLK